MKRLSIVLSIAIAFAAATASVASAASREERSLDDLLQYGAEIIAQALTEAEAAVRNHLDLGLRSQAGPGIGEQSTRFRLHIFPDGKDWPAKRFGLEGMLRYSEDALRDFHLDLRVITPTEDSPDYI